MYHFRFLIVPFFFFQYRIGIIYLPISILFLEGKKEREILRAESKKRNENTRIPLLSPFSPCACTMISQSKFDIQQSGNTMNSKRNSNRTIFKLLQQFDFIERKNIYIYIYLIPNSRCLLFPSSSSSSVTFESPIRNRVERVLRYLDASPSPLSSIASRDFALPPSTLLF